MHTCEAAVITCEDFRLHQRKDGRNYIAEFIKTLGVDCDLITRAGSIQDLVRPKSDDYCECELRDLSVSAKLHSAKTLYLVNHEDCGAYGGMSFRSREEELEQHKNDMLAAKDKINAEYPDLDVRLYFAELESGADDVFVIKALD